MKKIVGLLVVLVVAVCCAGCGERTVEQEKPSQVVMIGNPWSDWESIEEAEAATGFSIGLPDVIGDGYRAVGFRTMNNELLEVVYRNGDLEVCVRKQKGEGQDISGDYNQYDVCEEQNCNGGSVISYSKSDSDAVRQVISYKGYSWSLVAPNGYGDSDTDFVRLICAE